MAQRSVVELALGATMSLAVLAVMSPAFGYTEAFPPIANTLANLSAAQVELSASIPNAPPMLQEAVRLAEEDMIREARLGDPGAPELAQDVAPILAVIEQNNELFDSELSQAIIRELVTTLPAELAAEQAR